MSLLTAFGLMLVLSGTVVRAVALRRALLFAPAPVSAGMGPLLHPWPSRPANRSWGLTGSPAPTKRPGPVGPTHSPPPLPPHRTRILTTNRLLFLGCFTVYLLVGAVLALHFASFNGDAQARLANAYYVLFSRDPHLAAIGFVWNPLPSVLLMPLLPFKVLWPALTTRALAGNIESALFMAAAVCVLRGIVTDLRLPRPAGWLIVVTFAVNPMVLYYGGNGMSEALFLLALLLATRHLTRWVTTDSLRTLTLSGVWIGIGYLARNEAIAAGAAMVLLVAGRTFLVRQGERRQRVLAALADSIIIGIPIAAAFVGWAAVSYVITGHPFEQFSSQYGTASQLQVIGKSLVAGGLSRPAYMTMQMLSYAPALPVIVVLAASRAWRARDLRPLAPIAVLGGVLAFALLGYVAGQTAGWFRYTIVTLPLAIVLTAFLLAEQRGGSNRHWPRVQRRRPLVALAVAGALILPSLPVTAWAMFDPLVGREERQHLVWVFRGAANEGERQERDRLRSTEAIARFLDELHEPNGSIILDTFSPCAPFIVLASRRPHQFVITNDRDFEPVLADPIAFKARYLLLPPNVGYGTLDAVNRAYPDLYEKGAGLATLVHEFNAAGCPPFRLYRVASSATTEPSATLPTGGGGR